MELNLKQQFLQVSKPLITKADISAVNEVLKKGWISSEGPQVKRFENLFSKYIKMKYSIAVSNGTAALEIAVKSLNLKKNHEIIIPDFTIISNALAAIKNGNKIITTSGGGILISKENKLIATAKHLATQAKDPGVSYQHSQIGYNYRISNILASIGIGQLSVLEERVLARRSNYNRYVDYFLNWNLKGFNFEFQIEPAGFYSNRWLTCILVDPIKNKGLDVEIIRLALENDQIEARPVWKPMHLQPIFSSSLFYSNGVSDRLFQIGLCLPSGSSLTDEDFDRIFTCLDTLLNKY